MSEFSSRKFKKIFIELQSIRSPESVIHAKYKTVQPYEKYFFNLSLTYRVDADIVFPYAVMIDIASGKKISPGINIKWKTPNANFSGE